MYERAELLGGRLSIQSAAGHGTRVSPRPAAPRGGALMQTIRVGIVDDHALVRDGLRLILEREPDIDVVGDAPMRRPPSRWPRPASRTS